MDGWDIALLVVAAYLAVMGLVRLMRAQRDYWVAELRRQAEAEQQRKRQAELAKAQAAKTAGKRAA
jgi:hypothetical protein